MKISALSSGKIDKYEYLKGEEVLGVLSLSNKTDELKQTEIVFAKSLMTELANSKLLEIIKSQSSVKLDNTEYTTNKGKQYNFSKFSLHFVFMKEIYER